MPREFLGARYISHAEALKLLEEIEGELRGGEVAHRIPLKTLRYLKKFTKCDFEKVKELDEFLKELGVPEEVRVNIENICPKTVEELKVILEVGEGFSMDPEEMKEVVEKIKELLGE